MELFRDDSTKGKFMARTGAEYKANARKRTLRTWLVGLGIAVHGSPSFIGGIVGMNGGDITPWVVLMCLFLLLSLPVCVKLGKLGWQQHRQEAERIADKPLRVQARIKTST